MFLTGDFVPNYHTFSLLQRTENFIPVPSSCPHRIIHKQVRDFVRKLQWRSLFGWSYNHDQSRNRFGTSYSDKWPPINSLPPFVKRISKELLSASHSVLRSCNRCFPDDNLGIEERNELNRLRDADDVIITQADKGHRWVIMKESSYRDEALRQLLDTNTYSQLQVPIAPNVKSKLTQLLKYLKIRHIITKKEYDYLIPPTDFNNRRFKILPKIHKLNWINDATPPGRPIISDVNSESRNTSNLLEYFLRPLAQRSNSFLLDSLHAIAHIRNSTIPPNSFVFTLDVESLYTKVPIQETIDLISELFLLYPDPKRPSLTLLTILNLILKNNDFQFESHNFLQNAGVAMGKSFSGSFCNIFMNRWETNALNSSHLKPKLWIRYQDDIFGIWTYSLPEFDSFVEHINQQHPNIKLTPSISQKIVNFLDLEILINGQKLDYNLYFKPTDSHFTLSKDSYHPKHTYAGVIRGQIYRASTHSSSRDAFKKTLKSFKYIWFQQGITRSLFRTSLNSVLNTTLQFHQWSTGFFPCNRAGCPCTRYSTETNVLTIRHNNVLYPILHRITCQTKSVIYLIQCTKCSSQYIGQTTRPLNVRIKEHISDIRSQDATRSILSRHFNTNRCQIKDFSFIAIEHCDDKTKIIKRETHWIKKLRTFQPHGMNSSTCSLFNETRLILPMSICSKRLSRLISHKTRFLTKTKTIYTKHRNLKSYLNRKI